jgi:outer membrane protein TolC
MVASAVLLWLVLAAGTSYIRGVEGLDPTPYEAEAPLDLEAGRDFHAADTQLLRLLGILLEEHPSIRWAKAQWRSGMERVSQERSLPDPLLAFRVFAPTPETRVGPQRQGLEISQGIPWRGKRALQGERAEHQAESIAWQVRDLERDLIADLKQAYFDAGYLQEALAINTEEMALLERFEAIALRRYATGEGIQQSVIKVQTDISRLADREISLKERLDAVSRRIAELIGRPEEGLELEPISLSLLELEYDSLDLEREAGELHPEIRGAQAQIKAAGAWSKRRRLEGRPDFRIGLGYTRVTDREDDPALLNPPDENGKDSLAFTVGINLPIYRERIHGGVAEAEESLQAGLHMLERTRDRLRFEVQESILKLRALGERARLYRDVLIPQAEESLGSAEASYSTGRQDFLDLLDAERILFQVRLTYHRLIADHWISLAALERSVSKPIPGDAETTSRDPKEDASDESQSRS